VSQPLPVPIGAIAHYNLLQQLPPSGPGDLYRARDTIAGRTVVVRVLPASFFADATARGRFMGHMEAAQAVSHPNVVTVFDVGEREGRAYVVFEFLQGQPLRTELADSPLPVRRAVGLAIQVAEGLAGSWVEGQGRASLTPEAVIVTAKGHAKIPLLDLASLGSLDADGRRLSDCRSPEEAAGRPRDERADVYVAGALLYEMLTASRPVSAGTPARPSSINPRVPSDLDDVVLRALAPDPGQRYQSVPTLAAELRSVAAILDVRAAGRDQKAAAQASRPWPRLLIAAAALGALAAAWWLAG